MIVTPVLALCALGMAAYGGFVIAHRQRDQQDAAKAQLRESWEKIQAQAIRDGVLDADGRPSQSPAEPQ